MSSKRPTVSVVVVTYNWVGALARVLESLSRQKVMPVDVIVADDGSRPDTGARIAEFAKTFPVPLKHYWQEDNGVRPARCRNMGALMAAGDYILFLDGDCLVPPNWVEAHMNLAERGWYVAGSRAFLNPEATQRTLAGELDPAAMPPSELMARGKELFIKASHARRAAGMALGPLRKIYARKTDRLASCNMAVWRSDLEKVGGFDESFTTYAHEDVDLGLRLIRAGVLKKRGDHAAWVLHLDHGRAPPSPESELLLVELKAATRILPKRSAFLDQKAANAAA